MNYQEQLLTPEWKEKRKEILKRDGYKCTSCGKKRSEFIGLVKDFGIKSFDEMKDDGFEVFNNNDESRDLFLIKKNFLNKVEFKSEKAASSEISKLKFGMKFKEPANKFEFGRPQLIAFLEDPPPLEDIIDLNIHQILY